MPTSIENLWDWDGFIWTEKDEAEVLYGLGESVKGDEWGWIWSDEDEDHAAYLRGDHIPFGDGLADDDLADDEAVEFSLR